MLLFQEFYYITTGRYRVRKAFRVVYKVEANGSVRAVNILDEPAALTVNSMAHLPSIQVSAHTYKSLLEMFKRQIAMHN